jgi:hypothetical protein
MIMKSEDRRLAALGYRSERPRFAYTEAGIRLITRGADGTAMSNDGKFQAPSGRKCRGHITEPDAIALQ